MDKPSTSRPDIFEVPARVDPSDNGEDKRSPLEQAFAELEQIYQTVPVGLGFADRDLRFVRVNQRLASINGASVEEHIGRTLREVIPEIADVAEPILRRVIETGEPVLDLETVGATGVEGSENRTWMVSYFPLVEEGEVVGVNTMVQDITDRKLAEQQLAQGVNQLERKVEERTAELTAALAALEGGIERRQHIENLMRAKTEIIDHIDGAINCTDKEGFITDWNHGAENLYGYKAHEIVGRHVSGILPPEEDLRDKRDRQRRLGSTGRLELSTRVKAKSGEYLSVRLVSSRLTDKDGNSVGSWTHSWDATHRDQAEREISLHKEALAHVQRVGTLGEMVAGLAHEIRQPLAAIVSYANGCVMRLESGKLDVEEFIVAAQAISTQGTRASQVVDRLREFMSRREVTRSEVELDELIVDAVELWSLGYAVPKEEVELVLCDPTPVVSVDPVQIEQVLINLLSNAGHATDRTEHGQRHIVVATHTEGANRVSISVVDNGRGVAGAGYDEIFEPFFTTKTESMGMGLSVCRRIVEAHGGEISAAPAAGGGTEVRFTLPVS